MVERFFFQFVPVDADHSDTNRSTKGTPLPDAGLFYRDAGIVLRSAIAMIACLPSRRLVRAAQNSSLYDTLGTPAHGHARLSAPGSATAGDREHASRTESSMSDSASTATYPAQEGGNSDGAR